MNTLQDLPIEIVQGIIQLIETHDLIALSQLNRWWAAQIYDICNKRIQELMSQGWTCMIFSQTLAAQRVGRCNTLEDSFSLMTVLDHVEPLTLDLVFNLHEVAENCNTEAPLHADTKRSIALYNNADRMIKIVTTFVGRNEGRNRLTFVDQLEPIHFTTSTFSLSTQSCQSMPVSVSTCSPPSSDAYLKYTLLRSPTDSLLGITDANRTYLQESTDSHQGENPYVLRLDNFICTLHWWLFKVEAARKVLNYTTTDLINVW